MIPTNLSVLEIILLVIAVIWSMIWAGIGMWKAAKKNDKAWFIIFLIIHTLGILEILYIYWFSKGKRKK